MSGAGGAPDLAAPGAGRAGLLAELVGRVRPQFRTDVYVVGDQDTILGGAICLVAGCARIERLHGLCSTHFQRWVKADRPDREVFAASTAALTRWAQPLLPCDVPGCGYGRIADAMCKAHGQAWRDGGRPPVREWAAAAVVLGPRNGVCRVGWCTVWATARTPLCNSHAARWRRLGRPALEEFTAALEVVPERREHVDVSVLPPRLRLEMQYALQERLDQQLFGVHPDVVNRSCRALAASGMSSVLDWDVQRWCQWLREGRHVAVTNRPFLSWMRRQVEALAEGSGWEVEYPRAVWRLRRLGITGHAATVSFEAITQDWLVDLVKRWARWRLTIGRSPTSVYHGVVAMRWFATFLRRHAGDVVGVEGLDRDVVERYLAFLSGDSGCSVPARRRHLGGLNTFLTDVRRHRWAPGLPGDAVVMADDFPPPHQLLPRGLSEHVMAQIEQDTNLDRWDDPVCRLVTVVLVRCGLRISAAVGLAADCLVRDSDGSPYVRYTNHKMRREAMVPADEDLAGQITAQVERNQARFGRNIPVLFPRRLANPNGDHAVSGSSYRNKMNVWLRRCDVRDEHGAAVHLTPHQWRHTLGTRLINRDVPQEVVRRVLDHDSPQMTAHYARISDATVRRHWQAAHAVDAAGQAVVLRADGMPAPGVDDPMALARWTRHRLEQVAQVLPNGYCALPRQRSCPHANACLTCPTFLTTVQFLPEHRRQRRQTVELIDRARARGHTRVVEMNEKIAENLGRIITVLDDEEHHGDADPASGGPA